MNSQEQVQIIASLLSCALMVMQIIGGACVAALSVRYNFISPDLSVIGLLLMITAPFYVLGSIERQERLRRRQQK